MGKTAIILGASGLTGSLLLEKLTADERYDVIKIISRSSVNSTSNKVQEHLGDLLNMKQFKAVFKADEVYCCIGTTASKTKDRQMYKAIDFGIPVAAAKLAKENGIATFMVISAMGANAKSNIFYNRTKGEMEQAVLQEKVDNTYVLRPSLITGGRKEKRTGEKFAITIFKFINYLLIGPFAKYQSIKAESIAEAMIHLANSDSDKSIIESDKIEEIGSINA